MRWARSNRLAVVVIVGLSAACAALFLAKGAGHTFDDWLLLRNVRLGGVAHTVESPSDRPLASLLWLVFFGLLEGRPTPLVLLGAAGVAAAGLLLYDIVQRLANRQIALLAGALWVLLPTRTSIEMWLTTTVIAVAAALALGALRASIAGEQRRWRRIAAIGLAAASLLIYETFGVLVVPGLVLLPRLAHGHWDRKLAGAAVTTGLAVAAYTLLNVAGSRPNINHPNLANVFPANFSWGIAPNQATQAVCLVLGLGGAFALIMRLCLRDWRRACGPEAWVVLAGLGVLVAGTLPYVRYRYEPLGAGDRQNVVSAIGAALTWAGVLAVAVRHRRPLGLVGVGALVVVASVTRVDRTSLWSAAGKDGDRYLTGVRAAIPRPPGEIILRAPQPVRGNIETFGLFYHVDAITQLAYGRDDVRARFAVDEAEYLATPAAQRYDVRAGSALLAVELVGDG